MNENNNINLVPNQNGYPPKKKSPILVIVLIGIILIAVITIVAFLLLNNSDKKESPKRKESNTNMNTNSNTNSNIKTNWSGIYENNEGTITIYQINEELLHFDLALNGGNASGSANISENVAEGKIFSTYTFTWNNWKIEFTTNDEDLKAGYFTKKEDYSKEQYYKDNYGDPSYLNSSINGVFKKDDSTITIYQTKESQAEILISQKFSVYSMSIPIVNGALSIEQESFGDIEKINITFTNDSITVTASSSDTDSLLNRINGSYKKEKSYTMDDILSENKQ